MTGRLPAFRTRRHLQDFLPGEAFFLGELRLGRADIVAFAERFDPQPFHLDDAAAGASLLGGLAASGWQANAEMVAALSRALLAETAGAAILAAPEIRWRRPVRPDLPLALEADVVAVAPPARPGEPGTVVLRMVASEPSGAPAVEMTLEVAVRSLETIP